MLAIDDDHWWFVGRRAVVAGVLGHGTGLRVLDAGCGSGRTMDMLAPMGEVSGIDLDEGAIAAAGRRGHADVQVVAVEELPFADGTFDLITCLDVLEHTSDDVVALTELHRVLRPGGRIVITVPAFASLWSGHDVSHHHHRRYRSGGLRAAATAAGFAPVRDTYFNTVLFPAAAAVRLVDRARGAKPNASHLELAPGVLDEPFERILRAEARLIEQGRRLPYGLSLLGVFDRPGDGR